jgi:hypothetical protein
LHGIASELVVREQVARETPQRVPVRAELFGGE